MSSFFLARMVSRLPQGFPEFKTQGTGRGWIILAPLRMWPSLINSQPLATHILTRARFIQTLPRSHQLMVDTRLLEYVDCVGMYVFLNIYILEKGYTFLFFLANGFTHQIRVYINSIYYFFHQKKFGYIKVCGFW